MGGPFGFFVKQAAMRFASVTFVDAVYYGIRANCLCGCGTNSRISEFPFAGVQMQVHAAGKRG